MLRTLTQCLVSMSIAFAGPAAALSIDFDNGDFAGFVHGSVAADPQAFYSEFDLDVLNPNRKFDLAVTFDSNIDPGTTSDRDLVRDGTWSGGNIASQNLGNMLILQENEDCADALCSDPDDEGSHPAGTLRFELERLFRHFAFVLVDIEADEKDGDPGSITFYRGKSVVAHYDFIDFLTLGQSVVFGNNTANRIVLNDLSRFDAFEVAMGRSGAIDSILAQSKNPIPEPGTGALAALGLAILGFAGRSRRV